MPTAVDLFCGLGGWTEGLIAEGFRVVGIDIEEHVYGEHRYPGKLILADVLTLHGSLFARADLIVASPPCQEYSYMAMPWKRAKAKAAAIRADTSGAEMARLTQLFNACFHIQREASEAAGRHIPLVVENVRGAQPWVGKAAGNFGSFYLWGDVPELPKAVKAQKFNPDGTAHPPGSWFAIADSKNRGANSGEKVPGFRFDGSGKSFQSASVNGMKAAQDGLGGYGGNFGWNNTPLRRGNSTSAGRKMASAMIAKIPMALSTHIARHYHPDKTRQGTFLVL